MHWRAGRMGEEARGVYESRQMARNQEGGKLV